MSLQQMKRIDSIISCIEYLINSDGKYVKDIKLSMACVSKENLFPKISYKCAQNQFDKNNFVNYDGKDKLYLIFERTMGTQYYFDLKIKNKLNR